MGAALSFLEPGLICLGVVDNKRQLTSTLNFDTEQKGAGNGLSTVGEHCIDA
jgi:hypothetical protein